MAKKKVKPATKTEAPDLVPRPTLPEDSTPEASTPEPSTPEASTPEPSKPEPSEPEPSKPEPSGFTGWIQYAMPPQPSPCSPPEPPGPIDGPAYALSEGRSAAQASPLLRPGVHVWVWPNRGWASIDVGKLVQFCVDNGISGVLPHYADGGLAWLQKAETPLKQAGLQIVGSLSIVSTDRIAALLEASSVVDGCMMDWEGAWDGQQNKAKTIMQQIQDRFGSAANGRVIDCPWWAPLKTPSGKPSHPSAPNAQFGRFAVDRYVQAYGAPVDKRSTSMLSWARSPTQWASLGNWKIRGAFQAYKRSVSDQVRTLMAESTSQQDACCMWDYTEFDVNFTFALKIRAKLVSVGFVGANAVSDFQRAQGGLAVDGICGPKTTAALGLIAPAGVVWTHPVF